MSYIITKITIAGLNAANMGEATEQDSAGYRAWLGEQLAAEFPGVEIELEEQDRTHSVAVEVDESGEEIGYYAALDRVQAFAENCWDRCPWDWVA